MEVHSVSTLYPYFKDISIMNLQMKMYLIPIRKWEKNTNFIPFSTTFSFNVIDMYLSVRKHSILKSVFFKLYYFHKSTIFKECFFLQGLPDQMIYFTLMQNKSHMKTIFTHCLQWYMIKSCYNNNNWGVLLVIS